MTTTDPGINRSQPFSDEAEKGVLSCFLQRPELIYDAQETLPIPAFYHPSNRLIYEVLLELHANGTALDIVSISHHLLNTQQINKVGGPATLAELLSFIPTPAHYEYYKEVMINHFRVRMVINRATSWIIACYEKGAITTTEGVDALIDRVAAEALQIHTETRGAEGPKKLGYTVPEIHDEMVEEERNGIAMGIHSMQFPWLTEQIMGFQPDQVILLAGPRGGGKTVAAFQLLWELSNEGTPCSYYSLEVRKQWLYRRACCIEGVHSEAWGSNTFNRDELEIRARVSTSKAALKIHDDCRRLDDILCRMRMEVLRRKLRVVVIDGPGRVESHSMGNREQELSNIVWRFKQFAADNGCTVILPIHLNTKGVARGSEDMENHADVMVKIAPSTAKRTDASILLNPGHPTLFKITKNRNGPSGKRAMYQLIGEHYKFEERGETKNDIEDEEKGFA